MDYHTKKPKMASLLFILAFGSSVMQANNCHEAHTATAVTAPQQRLAVTHADSWKAIKCQLSCGDELAKEVRHFLINIDEAIFQYLHYNGPEKKYATHIAKFKNHLATLKQIIDHHDRHPGCTHAVHTLKEMQKSLTDLIKHVTKAQGSKGILGAAALGKEVDPLIRNFKSYFPLIMLTVDDQIRAHYNIQDVTATVLLGHIQKRLELK
jgi:hypothetical protein